MGRTIRLRPGKAEHVRVVSAGRTWTACVNEPLSAVLMSITEAEKTAALVKLARTTAHELNNIFTVVGGNLALLDEAISPGDPMAETIEEIQRAVARAVLLSSKLQALSGQPAPSAT